MSRAPLDHATLEAAASWYVDLRCETPDDAKREAHEQWLASDPRHQQAWERLARLQGKLERVTPGLGRPALTNARAKRREVLKVLAILLAAGGTSALGWRATPLPEWAADQRTGTGERRRLRLEDGTQVQLNTGTALNIRFNDTLRELQLLQGEVLIETASDPLQRPFVVHTAEGSLRALGTRFMVRRDHELTFLTVQEHAVEIRPAEAPDTVLKVSAGEQVNFSAMALGKVTPAELQTDAWTRDMLVVSNWRLGDFIHELQRYRPGYLGCDPTVAALRISGAFHLGNTDNVLEHLRATLPVRVKQLTRYWVRIEAV